MSHKQWHDCHHAIATFALPILKDYYIFKSGYPGPLLKEFTDSPSEDCDAHELARARWDQILLGIINAFQHITNPEWERTETSDAIDQEYLTLFGRWFTHLWD
jgi:hypothetical protein